MNSEKIDLIKIGGSVITDKRVYAKLEERYLDSICKDIATWGGRCIIVHGAGSFGHMVASEYNIGQGYTTDEQLQGIIKIRNDMNSLSMHVVNNLHRYDVPALNFQTSAFVYTNLKHNQNQVFFSPIRKSLSLGFIPVLSGDISFDTQLDFTIFSGDSLIELLVEKFEVNRVIFITNVDGIWVSTDSSETASLVEKASISDLDKFSLLSISDDETIDVTGKMAGKMNSIKKILNHVNEVILVNGQKENRVKAVLNKQDTICTMINNS